MRIAALCRVLVHLFSGTSKANVRNQSVVRHCEENDGASAWGDLRGEGYHVRASPVAVRVPMHLPVVF